MEVLLFFAMAVAVIGGIAWYSHQQNKKRTEAFLKQSEAMGASIQSGRQRSS